jgi:hypothetical protein
VSAAQQARLLGVRVVWLCTVPDSVVFEGHNSPAPSLSQCSSGQQEVPAGAGVDGMAPDRPTEQSQLAGAAEVSTATGVVRLVSASVLSQDGRGEAKGVAKDSAERACATVAGPTAQPLSLLSAMGSSGTLPMAQRVEPPGAVQAEAKRKAEEGLLRDTVGPRFLETSRSKASRLLATFGVT